MQVRKLPALLALGLSLGLGTAWAQDGSEPSAEGGAPVVDATPAEAEVDPEAAERERIEFSKELRTVEEAVGALKERVFRSKATLQLLKELVIEGAAIGSRVEIWHVNELPGGYAMQSAQYFLNGRSIFSKVDAEDSLHENREFKIHEQTLPPGEHNLQVQMMLRGKGFNVFTYLQAYSFPRQAEFDFKVEEGRMSTIRVTTLSQGSLKSYEERPQIQFNARLESNQQP